MDKKIVDLTYPFTKTTQHWPTAKAFHLEKVAEGRTPKSHGRIGASSIVLAHTGWGQYWGDRKRYFGTDEPGNVTNLHFQGCRRRLRNFWSSKEASRPSASTRRVSTMARRRLSLCIKFLEPLTCRFSKTSLQWSACLQNPATICALPMKIAGGSGAPLRIFAILP